MFCYIKLLIEAGLLDGSLPLSVISSVLLWITAVLAVISGIIYIKDGVKVIDFSK